MKCPYKPWSRLSLSRTETRVKQQIVEMTLTCLWVRDIARVLHVSPATVIQRRGRGFLGERGIIEVDLTPPKATDMFQWGLPSTNFVCGRSVWNVSPCPLLPSPCLLFKEIAKGADRAKFIAEILSGCIANSRILRFCPQQIFLPTTRNVPRSSTSFHYLATSSSYRQFSFLPIPCGRRQHSNGQLKHAIEVFQSSEVTTDSASLEDV